MIDIKGVNFSYGSKQVLNDFSLQVKRGERVCLFGESGSGKTTVLRLIMGLESADKGSVNVNGKLSVVFQENRLLPFETVIGNIKAVNGDTDTAYKLLGEFGLYEYSDKYPRSLSGGMKRKVAIIRALSRSYDCLILDEPFAGLDKENIELIAEIINELTSDKTVILITHSKWEAQLLNTEIINIKKAQA